MTVSNCIFIIAHLLSLQHKTQLLNKPEEMLMMLQTYLPNGLLLFSSEQYNKVLKREFEENLTATGS